MVLRVNLFDAVDGTDFDAEATEGAAPGVDGVISSVCDDGILRADKMTIVAGYAGGGDLKFLNTHF